MKRVFGVMALVLAAGDAGDVHIAVV